MGASTSARLHGTHVPVEKPSTASKAEVDHPSGRIERLEVQPSLKEEF
jgi:hypothetical protein